MVSRAAVEAETATTSTTELMSSGPLLSLSLFALSSSCLLLAFVSLVILCLLLFLLFFLLISVGRSLGVITGKSKRDQVEAVLLFLFSVFVSWATHKEILGYGNRRFFAGFPHYPLWILPFVLFELLLDSFDAGRVLVESGCRE